MSAATPSKAPWKPGQDHSPRKVAAEDRSLALRSRDQRPFVVLRPDDPAPRLAAISSS